MKKSLAIFLCMSFVFLSQSLYSSSLTQLQTVTYYLVINDFINSLIEIPTSNISVSSTTIASKYIAGTVPIYDVNNMPVGTCSASFLCMENDAGIFTDISNYISVDNGLIVSWFTPTKPINLELDSIINSMVTDCTVQATTKIGVNSFFWTNI